LLGVPGVLLGVFIQHITLILKRSLCKNGKGGKKKYTICADTSIPMQVQSSRKPRSAAAFRWWVLIQENTW